jgi:hypothetical protein
MLQYDPSIGSHGALLIVEPQEQQQQQQLLLPIVQDEHSAGVAAAVSTGPAPGGMKIPSDTPAASWGPCSQGVASSLWGSPTRRQLHDLAAAFDHLAAAPSCSGGGGDAAAAADTTAAAAAAAAAVPKHAGLAADKDGHVQEVPVEVLHAGELHALVCNEKSWSSNGATVDCGGSMAASTTLTPRCLPALESPCVLAPPVVLGVPAACTSAGGASAWPLPLLAPTAAAACMPQNMCWQAEPAAAAASDVLPRCQAHETHSLPPPVHPLPQWRMPPQLSAPVLPQLQHHQHHAVVSGQPELLLRQFDDSLCGLLAEVERLEQQQATCRHELRAAWPPCVNGRAAMPVGTEVHWGSGGNGWRDTLYHDTYDDNYDALAVLNALD